MKFDLISLFAERNNEKDDLVKRLGSEMKRFNILIRRFNSTVTIDLTSIRNKTYIPRYIRSPFGPIC